MRLSRRQPAADGAQVGADSSDADLLTATAAEDVAALEILYRRHAPWVRLRLLRRSHDEDAVEAALQDTFVAIWRDAGRFTAQTADGDAAGWIWTIAIRRLIAVVRGKGGRWASQVRVVSMSPNDAVTVSVEDAVLQGVEYGRLGPALEALSPELRAAIQATVLDGLTMTEASRLLGVPSGTIKTRVMRAKAKLREQLS